MNGRLLALVLGVIVVAILFVVGTSLALSGCGTEPLSGPATSPDLSSQTSAGTGSGSQGTSVTDVTMPPHDSPTAPIYAAGRIVNSHEERVLLENVGGAWTVREVESMDKATQRDFTNRLRQRYSGIPKGILP